MTVILLVVQHWGGFNTKKYGSRIELGGFEGSGGRKRLGEVSRWTSGTGDERGVYLHKNYHARPASFKAFYLFISASITKSRSSSGSTTREEASAGRSRTVR